MNARTKTNDRQRILWMSDVRTHAVTHAHIHAQSTHTTSWTRDEAEKKNFFFLMHSNEDGWIISAFVMMPNNRFGVVTYSNIIHELQTELNWFSFRIRFTWREFTFPVAKKMNIYSRWKSKNFATDESVLNIKNQFRKWAACCVVVSEQVKHIECEKEQDGDAETSHINLSKRVTFSFDLHWEKVENLFLRRWVFIEFNFYISSFFKRATSESILWISTLRWQLILHQKNAFGSRLHEIFVRKF